MSDPEIVDQLLAKRESVERCPLCGSRESDHFDTSTVRGESVINRMCTSCGLIYQSPRMTAEALKEYYHTAYMEMHQGQSFVTEEQLQVQRGRADHLLSLLRQSVGQVGRHLDIGCSTGELMTSISKAFGCASVGVEPGEEYRAYARERGFEVHDSLESLGAATPDSFDLVTMAHVLEHLREGTSYLRRLRKDLLLPGGHLLVEVPNLFFHPSFELPHLVSYHRGTLVDQLRQGGFQVEWMHIHGLPRHRRIPLYLTALARPISPGEPLPAIQSRPRAIKLRRLLGQWIYASAPRFMRLLRRLSGTNGNPLAEEDEIESGRAA